MNLGIEQDQLDLVQQGDNVVILGLITVTGQIRLAIADQVNLPGHRDWIRKQPDLDVFGGFSLLVRGGEVKGFFSSSILNQTTDARLSANHVQQILGLLPVAPDVIIYGG